MGLESSEPSARGDKRQPNTYETFAVDDYVSRHRRRRTTRLYYPRITPERTRRNLNPQRLRGSRDTNVAARRSSRVKFVRATSGDFSTFHVAIRSGEESFYRTFGSSIHGAGRTP